MPGQPSPLLLLRESWRARNGDVLRAVLSQRSMVFPKPLLGTIAHDVLADPTPATLQFLMGVGFRPFWDVPDDQGVERPLAHTLLRAGKPWSWIEGLLEHGLRLDQRATVSDVEDGTTLVHAAVHGGNPDAVAGAVAAFRAAAKDPHRKDESDVTPLETVGWSRIDPTNPFEPWRRTVDILFEDLQAHAKKKPTAQDVWSTVLNETINRFVTDEDEESGLPPCDPRLLTPLVAGLLAAGAPPLDVRASSPHGTEVPLLLVLNLPPDRLPLEVLDLLRVPPAAVPGLWEWVGRGGHKEAVIDRLLAQGHALVTEHGTPGLDALVLAHKDPVWAQAYADRIGLERQTPSPAQSPPRVRL